MFPWERFCRVVSIRRWSSRWLKRNLQEPLNTFSIGFREAEFDETKYARQVAAWVRTEHREYKVTPDAVSILDQLVYHYDEPFGDSSAIPTWYLCQWTREHVKVALTGDGGDELFAGYERYRALALSRWVDRLAGPVLGSRFIQGLPASNRRRSFVRRLQRFGEALNQPLARRYMNWIQIFPERMRGDLYTEDFVAQLPDEDPFEFFETAWNQLAPRDLIARASLADLVTYLPCDLMTKVDIASMAHGLECRQPLLDYRLVEFAAALPSATSNIVAEWANDCCVGRSIACCRARSGRVRRWALEFRWGVGFKTNCASSPSSDCWAATRAVTSSSGPTPYGRSSMST